MMITPSSWLLLRHSGMGGYAKAAKASRASGITQSQKSPQKMYCEATRAEIGAKVGDWNRLPHAASL